ncbi:MAG TPA: putative selenium-dependent hydroxylase accessory protein YqeC [Chloroflexi bacterium]|nr:putative selenium-dependent hydroxylase accessory protein YqeC [Chloroflexota bacterium]HHW86268.1 putative selenium-dependent hydroxylase accessory protein YqeC [Chloroflexota bacterium]
MLLHQGLRLTLNPLAPDVVALVGGGGKSSTAFRLAAEVAAVGKRAVIAPSTRIAAFQTAWAPAFLEVGDAELPFTAIEQQLVQHGYCLLGGPVVGDRRLGLQPEQIDALAQRAADLGVAAITVEADGSKMRPLKAPAAHEPVLPAATTHLVPVAGLDAVGAVIDERAVHRPELVSEVLGAPLEPPLRLTPAHLARLLHHPAGGAKGLHPGMHFVPLLNKADTPLRLVYGRLTAALLAEQGVTSLVARVGETAQPPVVERWGPVAVVILAAGGSRRLGRPKQLEVVAGAPLLAHAVRTAQQSGSGPVLVVTGAEEQSVHALLAEIGVNVTIVANPLWAAGQATSVRAALQALPAAVTAAIFAPVDQPFLEPLLLRRLVNAWRTGGDLVAPLVEGELRGAPALFDRSYWGELAALQGDVGGRRVLQAHYAQVIPVPAEAAWLYDIDSEDDLQALRY